MNVEDESYLFHLFFQLHPPLVSLFGRFDHILYVLFHVETVSLKDAYHFKLDVGSN